MTAFRTTWIYLLAGLLTAAAFTPPLLAQSNYDQQQWWNPGDWFDDQPQYNLFSDNYWNNHQSYSDTWDYDNEPWDNDYGYYDYNEPWDNDYGYYDYNEPWDNDYGYYDNWDYNDQLEYGSNSSQTNKAGATGSAGGYESGNRSGSESSSGR